MNFIEILNFIKELVCDNEKMGKFKEVVADIKELVNDIKDVINFFKKDEKEA